MTRIALVCMLAGVSSFACAQEPVPNRKSGTDGGPLQTRVIPLKDLPTLSKIPHVGRLFRASAPNAAAAPGAPRVSEGDSPIFPTGKSGQSPGCSSIADKLQHLLQAADHLEAAGEIEQARSLRQQADAERQTLLNRLESLQAELDRLRQIVGCAPQILVQVRMIELSHTKLRNQGFDTSKLREAGLSGNTENNATPLGFRVIEADGRLLEVLQAMRKDNLVKVLAEPTLVTLSGRPASFNVGGQYPVLVPQSDGSQVMQYRDYGTHVDLQATLLGNGKIRLEVRFRVSELVSEHSIQVGQHTFPGLNVSQVDTTVEMQAGQTVNLGGMRTRVTKRAPQPAADTANAGTPNTNDDQLDEVTEETELLVLITPQIVEPMTAAARLPAAPQAIR